jgi:flavin-binding protein dodecin
MSDNIYKIIEIVGSSATGIEDAVEKAIARASSTIDEVAGSRSRKPAAMSRTAASLIIR